MIIIAKYLILLLKAIGRSSVISNTKSIMHKKLNEKSENPAIPSRISSKENLISIIDRLLSVMGPPSTTKKLFNVQRIIDCNRLNKNKLAIDIRATILMVLCFICILLFPYRI